MPAVNSAGNTRIEQNDMPLPAWAGGDAEQRDLGRGVEAEAEQKADRKIASSWPTMLNIGRNMRARTARGC